MNINQSLIIHKFPVLFGVLNELKKYLNFKIEHFENEEFTKIPKESNLVIISGSKKKILKTKFIFMNFL